MTHIVFVKKILANGEMCKKCQEVSERLSTEGLIEYIDEIAIADERDASSTGMRLAKQHNVERAPFFLVEDGEDILVFDIYFKFKKYMAQNGVELKANEL